MDRRESHFSSLKRNNPNLVNLSDIQLRVVKRSSETAPFDRMKIDETIRRCSQGFSHRVNHELLFNELVRNIFDGVSTEDLEKALVLTAVAFIGKDPVYDRLATNFLLQKMYKEVIGPLSNDQQLYEGYRKVFVRNIHKGINVKRVDPRLADFPLEELADHLDVKRDDQFKYMGLQILYERYFLRHNNNILELPQAFWMRVAMGLAIGEKNKVEKAIEFYHILSTFRYMSSTPTLLHAGTVRPQLSSCYLTFIDDDLEHIFKCFKDNAMLSKWSGGIGNDWTSIRATGAPIHSINTESQGLIPFLKIANDVVAAINRSGKRRGATVAYLEIWHYDFEDFADLRRNTGDDRRRAHDMNTASWIPDLFMKRVLNGQDWTLFSPSEVPDLHDLYGKKFEEAYVEYERRADCGEVALFKKIPAKKLWRKLLSRLFETGHPWITFKDACNVRSPQDHVGVVHSSNLCTEITLNTSREETAVCNLGSINLGQHIIDGKLDREMLAETIRKAIRMLDNVVDINFYPTQEAKTSNERHRPIGLGLMGLQDALFKLDFAFEDPQAIAFADEVMEEISYHAILASSELAKEKGTYQSYKGSKWDRGLFPYDTVDLLEKERGVTIDVDRTSTKDWLLVRDHVKKYGMRNSNVMAIAPTATISNIVGCFPCIEPIYKNIYVKANLTGEFTVVNEYLVNDLKQLGLWSEEMFNDIKYYDGSIQHIDAIPAHIKRKYKESFEIDPLLLIKFTARRAKWIDQSQSHNVFMQGASGKKLNDIYLTAWKSGLKATYYLRTMGASQIEKSTLDAKKYGYTQKRVYNKDLAGNNVVATEVNGQACGIDEECESCQ